MSLPISKKIINSSLIAALLAVSPVQAETTDDFYEEESSTASPSYSGAYVNPIINMNNGSLTNLEDIRERLVQNRADFVPSAENMTRGSSQVGVGAGAGAAAAAAALGSRRIAPNGGGIQTPVMPGVVTLKPSRSFEPPRPKTEKISAVKK